MNLVKRGTVKNSAPFFDLKDGSYYVDSNHRSVAPLMFVLALIFTGIVIFFLGM